jgi:CubicO group peptidase (beta-lactamase class C family)
MNACLRFVFLLSLLAEMVFPTRCSAAQPPVDGAAIDQFIAAQLAAQRVPGLALAIVRGGEVLSVKGYGTAGNGQPVTPQTQFFIASLSKSITALAVMQLVEAGAIDLDAPVQRYLPDFALADPQHAARLTMRQLLHQTSGLADAGFPEALLPQPASLAERIASMRAARPVAPPSVAFHYFNPNYQVLARVVEVVSGQPFATYLQTHIFTPLKMEDTFSAATAAGGIQRAERLAQGHLVVFGAPLAAPEMDGYLGGSGGVISTAADMAHYLVAQINGGRFQDMAVASPAAIATMHTPPRQPTSDYAMGWFVHHDAGVPVIEHNGVLSTFYSEAVLLPERGYGFVLLANANGAASAFVGFAAIKRGLIALLSGSTPLGGSINVGQIGLMMALITLIGAGLGLRRLLRLRRWAEQARSRPWWRLLPGIVWPFVPGVVLLGLPSLLVPLADRAFGYAELSRSMRDVVIWLGLTGALGAITGVARLALLKKGNGR